MKRTRGRPPLDDNDPSVQVAVRMPSKQYDELCERALQQRVSLPEIIRRDLQQQQKRTQK